MVVAEEKADNIRKQEKGFVVQYLVRIVKTVTKSFPMSHVSQIEQQQRGDHKGLIVKGADVLPTLATQKRRDPAPPDTSRIHMVPTY